MVKKELKKFEKKIFAYALANALSHDGKAQAGAVLPKLFQEGLRKEQIKEIMPLIQKTINEVNKLSRREQEKEFESLKDLIKQREEKEELLPELPNAKKGKVITAFPPEPSGYPHIGHAKGAIVNYEYAKKYQGKFILRFEDTNPELVKKEFYDAQLEGYKWLGLKWDKLIYISDIIPEMYKKARELIKKGYLYACDCSIDEIRNKRMTGKECNCRKRTAAESLKLFENMLKGKFDKGQVIIRWKGSMKHKNTAMRDPTMFRVIKEKHPRVKKVIVWPAYDFAASYSDGIEGITHRIRSKEFELRAELQKELQKLMGFKQTIIIEQARFNLKGVEASKRKIREKIATGELMGWDDPRLATLASLKRRGFRAEAIKNFLLKMGITKHESILEWNNLEAENRGIIDPIANRYFFIENAVKITIKDAPKQQVELDLHPENKKGGRKFKTHKEFYITKEDFGNLKQGKLYRLMDCLNFIKKDKQLIFDSLEYKKYRGKGSGIFHWLPADAKNLNVEIMMPDAKLVKGIVEENIKKLKVDDVCQLERFGFCRLDAKEKNKIVFWFSHK